jgi:hypothetical protein
LMPPGTLGKQHHSDVLSRAVILKRCRQHSVNKWYLEVEVRDYRHLRPEAKHALAQAVDASETRTGPAARHT